MPGAVSSFAGAALIAVPAPLVTCDQAVFSNHRRRELFRVFGAVAVDMESGAVAQVAALNRLPFIAIRAVSDAHDLEIRDYSRLDKLQADSPLDKAKGAAGLLREPDHLRFLKNMKGRFLPGLPPAGFHLARIRRKLPAPPSPDLIKDMARPGERD